MNVGIIGAGHIGGTLTEKLAGLLVSELIDEIGFDGLDVGGLAEGRRNIQPGSPVYVAHLTAAELVHRLAA
jgi:predicted dinucleotide-binding enzyme